MRSPRNPVRFTGPEATIIGAVFPKAITVEDISLLVDRMAGERLHAKQEHGVMNAVGGVVHAVSLSVHAIGVGLAAACGLQPKNAIKQVDRLLSNAALDVWALFAHWVRYVASSTPPSSWRCIGPVSNADGHATIALSLVTAHGRALPFPSACGQRIPVAEGFEWVNRSSESHSWLRSGPARSLEPNG